MDFRKTRVGLYHLENADKLACRIVLISDIYVLEISLHRSNRGIFKFKFNRSMIDFVCKSELHSMCNIM